jgi:hypothetical protein
LAVAVRLSVAKNLLENPEYHKKLTEAKTSEEIKQVIMEFAEKQKLKVIHL